MNNSSFDVYKFDTESIGSGYKIIPVDNFYDFCEVCKFSPLSALYSFVKNHVTWVPIDGHHPINWPDDIIRKKEGNCVDFAIFMHYLFETFGVDHVIGFVAFMDMERFYFQTGHAVPLYKDGGKYWMWNYFGDQGEAYCDINGPFSSYGEMMNDVAPYFSVLYNSATNLEIQDQAIREYDWTYLDSKQLKFLDRYMNQTYISQNDVLLQSPEIVNLLERCRDTMIDRQKNSHNRYSNDIIDITPPALLFRKTPKENGIKSFLFKFSHKALRGVSYRGFSSQIRSLTRRSRTNKKNV